MAGAHLIDVVTDLAGRADDVRVLLRAMADEVMRYLYVVSSLGAGMSLALAGIVVTAAAIRLAGRRLDARTTIVEAGDVDAACRTPTRRARRGTWTSRRSIVCSRPRARSGGVST